MWHKFKDQNYLVDENWSYNWQIQQEALTTDFSHQGFQAYTKYWCKLNFEWYIHMDIILQCVW